MQYQIAYVQTHASVEYANVIWKKNVEEIMRLCGDYSWQHSRNNARFRFSLKIANC